MTKSDYRIGGGLIFLAFFMWLRDLAWMTTSDDTLPILIALPIFIWLGAPWKWRVERPVYSQSLLMWGVGLFVLGIGLNLTLLLALGWIILLSTWLTTRLQKETIAQYYRLLPLPLMAFPWISLDFNRLGWWFRLSGAWLTAHFFSAAGYDVIREGTMLMIDGVPISVEVACAGLNTLQSMLIAGTIMAYILLAETPRYWLAFPSLFIIAWIANTIRILTISLLALVVSPSFVMGPFHVIGGWGVLVLMFLLCWALFSILAPKEKT